MKALVLLGSRNPEGQTATAAQSLRSGVEAAGGEATDLFLTHLDIERCRQCDANGWGLCREEGRCVIEDDFADVVDKLREADAAVFATPVYFGDLSESMRSFLDRLRRVARHTDAKEGIAGKPAVGICVAGGGGGGAPNCTVSLERVLQHTGFDVVDMIPARRQNLGMKENVLQIVGTWLVNSQEVE